VFASDLAAMKKADDAFPQQSRRSKKIQLFVRDASGSA